MRHLRQTRKNNCGQTCVAVITRRKIDEIHEIVGKNGRTSGVDLRRALQKCGRICSVKSVRMTKPFIDYLESECIYNQTLLCMVTGSKMKHWIVVRGRHAYDPALDCRMHLSLYFPFLKREGGRITSYMVVLD